MEVILIEKINKLGDVGDQVVVKNGFARNYLIPQEKALRATQENKSYFEKQKKEILAKNDKIKAEAKKIFDKINNKAVVIISNASDEGRLYGSVLPKDIANKITEVFKTDIKKRQIILVKTLREIGVFKVKVRIHADYMAEVKVNIARSQEEAKENMKAKKTKVKDTDQKKAVEKESEQKNDTSTSDKTTASKQEEASKE